MDEQQRSFRRDREFDQRLKVYGITRVEMAEMFKRQGGQCGICHTPITYETCHIDHDHATGKVRGLLCRRCNPLLGLFENCGATAEDVVAWITRGKECLNGGDDTTRNEAGHQGDGL